MSEANEKHEIEEIGRQFKVIASTIKAASEKHLPALAEKLERTEPCMGRAIFFSEFKEATEKVRASEPNMEAAKGNLFDLHTQLEEALEAAEKAKNQIFAAIIMAESLMEDIR